MNNRPAYSYSVSLWDADFCGADVTVFDRSDDEDGFVPTVDDFVVIQCGKGHFVALDEDCDETLKVVKAFSLDDAIRLLVTTWWPKATPAVTA